MKQVFFASTLHFGSDTLFPLDYTVIITTVTFLLKSKGNVCIPGDAAGFDSLFEKRSSMMTVKSRWHSCKKKVLSTKTFSLPKNLQNTMRVQGVFKLLFSEFTQFCLKVCLKSRWSKKGLWSETEAFQAHVKWGLCHAWNASILSKTRDFFTKSSRFEKKRFPWTSLLKQFSQLSPWWSSWMQRKLPYLILLTLLYTRDWSCMSKKSTRKCFEVCCSLPRIWFIVIE